MAIGVHKITEQFEQELAKYTGSPFAVAVDNQSNALFLALMRENIKGRIVSIPSVTYPSVPCEIIHAGGIVNFIKAEGTTLKGAYQLKPTRVWDSALRFTYNMYIPDTYMCLSFTGPYKHLKLGKGGAILTDNFDSYLWFKRARFSGRRECNCCDDHFDMLGWNFYMMPEIAARGILFMSQFYRDDVPLSNEDLELRYPDLSNFSIYKGNNNYEL
ncbi:MAG: DegT/DnrJ/EryC1/StrS family aminotransferase [Methanogenium sp.]|jgi:dTDP-4-amino-4,6-dideoxygalactose transaminase